MVPNKSHIVFISDHTCSNSDQTIIRLVSSHHFLPESVHVNVVFLQVVLLGEPSSEDIQISGGVATLELIASMQLEICLLNQTDPEFALG